MASVKSKPATWKGPSRACQGSLSAGGGFTLEFSLEGCADMSGDALPLPTAVPAGIETQNGVGKAVDQREIVEDAEDRPGAAPGFLLEQGQHPHGQ